MPRSALIARLRCVADRYCASQELVWTERQLPLDFDMKSAAGAHVEVPGGHVYRSALSVTTAALHRKWWIIMETVAKLAKEDAFVTLRDLYYMHITVFHEQTDSNAAVLRVANIIGLTRYDMGIYASPRGLVYGSFFMKTPGFPRIDCDRAPQLITHTVVCPGFSVGSRSALCVLVVEKEGIFRRLVEDHFCDRIPCVLITGLGYPPEYVRALVSKASTTLRVPVYGLFDYGPHGIAQHLVYKLGSRGLGARYAVPSMQYIGLRGRDINLLHLDTTPFVPSDVSLAQSLMKRPFLALDGAVELRRELEQMLQGRRKAELQALFKAANSVRFLAHEYLPARILRRNAV